MDNIKILRNNEKELESSLQTIQSAEAKFFCEKNPKF